jgi:RimJ/RimL family protein N-acetyltransferase
MIHPFLISKNIYFRALQKEDLEGPYFDWLNDFHVTRLMESGKYPNTRDAMLAFFEKNANSPNFVIFAVCELTTDKHVGNIKLGPINWLHRTTNFGLMIGDRSSWGKGYATEAMHLIVAYAFDRLNLNKINLGVVAENTAATRVYEKVGFVIEGRVRENFIVEGKALDSVIMGMTAREYYARKGEKQN